MSNDNWKTATNGRDRKRAPKNTDAGDRVADKSSHKNRPDDAAAKLNNSQNNIDTPAIIEVGAAEHNDDPVIEPLVIPIAMPVDVKSADAKPNISWADVSEGPDIGRVVGAFMSEIGARCSNFSERASFIALTASTILDLGIKMIQDERNRIDASHNEKEFVRDLCSICSHGKKVIDDTMTMIHTIRKHMATYESEKNSALDGLKTFLASIDQTMVPAESNVASAKYAGVVGSRDPSANIKKSVNQQLMASVPLGPGQMILPMTRDRSDIMPMAIKYASDLGVFLINVDGKLYSFCNGVFVSRQSKTGDNTLYGKRCNPTSTRCVGTNCTYYHDPLTHTTGHTMRNMGVHYVISELINGVANDTEIAETARGKNKYIVEDIISLAGMLLIKAFQIKKIRDHHSAGY